MQVAVISVYFESKLPRSCKKFEVNKNTKHLYNHELPDCETDRFPLLGQEAAFPVLGQAQKWKLRPFPVLDLPKSGNCGRVSSFGPFPPLGLHKVV